jgi:threonine dehydratase
VEALAAQKESGATFVHAYNDPDVVAGQGTIATELLADLEDAGRAHSGVPANSRRSLRVRGVKRALPFDTVLVPVGGGGLIGGIALYLKSKKPGIKVIGVEPSGADAMYRSLRAGSIVTLDRVSTIADGLAASAPGQLTFELAQRYVDEVVLVEENELLRAIRLLFEWEHLLAEPAGAAALAALLYHHRPAPNERVVVILSGGNVTDEVMLRALKTR